MEKLYEKKVQKSKEINNRYLAFLFLQNIFADCIPYNILWLVYYLYTYVHIKYISTFIHLLCDISSLLSESEKKTEIKESRKNI